MLYLVKPFGDAKYSEAKARRRDQFNDWHKIMLIQKKLRNKTTPWKLWKMGGVYMYVQRI